MGLTLEVLPLPAEIFADTLAFERFIIALVTPRSKCRAEKKTVSNIYKNRGRWGV